MTVNGKPNTGAASHEANDWRSIDWRQHTRNVRRLQARIVKATQERRWGKVKALQRILTRSFSAKVLAVKRVTENNGRNTPGVDGATWRTPAKKMRAVQELKQRGYEALPLRRVYIPKSAGKLRPLGIPTMRDRAMQALYLLALDPSAETTADRSSFGFRVGRSCADALHKCYVVLGKKTSARWILDGDIRACFDRIDHEWLVEHIPIEKSILRKWLKAGYIEKDAFHHTDEGTPQGGVISPVLANMVLDGLERRLREFFPKARTMSQRDRVYLIRYADDFIVTGNSEELLREQVQPIVEAFLLERGLELSKEKTRITSIEEGFDFLGQTVRKYRGKFLTKPSKSSVSRLLGKVRGIIRKNCSAKAGSLIVTLNPIIRGWANYHRHAASKRMFAAVDHAIFSAVFHWARRRHPHKGSRWIADKYFERRGLRKWVFRGEVQGFAGRARPVGLIRASDTPIVRHVMVREEANPYDAKWHPYFAARQGRLSPLSLSIAAGRTVPTGTAGRNHSCVAASPLGER